MKFYKDNEGKIFAYELDGSQDDLIGDKVQLTAEELAEHLEPSIIQVIANYTVSIQTLLDNFAKTRGYDNCLSCCTYSNSSVEKFATEGQRMIELRDLTWHAAYELLSKFESGEIDQPSFDDVIAVLPELTWTE